MIWSERSIARALARQMFERKHLVLVPNCNWTGHECDLLVVTPDLRVIDVEIKISRADLKIDAKKDKWWKRLPHTYNRETRAWDAPPAPQPQHWPRKVWKHYYAMPRALWDDALFECLPSPASGVLLLEEGKSPHPAIRVQCVRRATPCKTADKISPAAAVDIARLASLRMWDAYEQLERKAA